MLDFFKKFSSKKGSSNCCSIEIKEVKGEEEGSCCDQGRTMDESCCDSK